jgi:peptidoglycan glycosyltransferase
MRAKLHFIPLIGALALIIYGLIQPVDQDSRWLLCLWGAAPLLGLAIWLSQPPLPRGLSRSVYNLALVVALGFVLLSLQLLRQQVVQAGAIYAHIEIDAETGQVISNVRPVLQAQRTKRGTIFDRNGIPLVSSEVAPNGFAHRIYPLTERFEPRAFSNITGFFSRQFGQSGLEATYGDYLSGTRGNSVRNLRNELLGNTLEGNNLQLTLNAELQARAAALLGGQSGSIVVLDPQTGAVLAMVSAPGFDPRGLSFDPTVPDWTTEDARIQQYWNELNDAAAGQPLVNRPTQGQYPPGSTFKTLTAVSILEHNAEPDNITCPNELPVETGAPPVVNAVPGLASLTGNPSNLERVYAYSCNTAFAQYALRLGTERLAETAREFDIYRPGDAPESYPYFTDLVTRPSRLFVQPGFLNRDAALADTGYGQGQLQVTPLQMALIAATIANDGVMPQPYLVQRVTDPAGNLILERRPRIIRQVMSADTAAIMRDNMAAVGQYGFGSVVSNFVSGAAVGGKSGTAEIGPNIAPHAWFIAIAPVDQPRYAVCVMIEHGGEGSGAAAQLAGQVLQAAFEVE